jgi:hypothetical protein
LEKTKIIVFRNGGILKSNEKWYYKNIKIDVVSWYKYLGLMVTSRLIWTKAQYTLAAQSLKAINIIRSLSKACGELDASLAFELFDKMVKPIITYEADIWGFKVNKVIADVQVKFCRMILAGTSLLSKNCIAVFAMQVHNCIAFHQTCIAVFFAMQNFCIAVF